MKTLANGILRKMASRLQQPVTYHMRIGDDRFPVNQLIGETIKLEYSGNIFCVHCGRKSNKSFNQGYCYPCFQRLAQCDSCIVYPEKCHFDQGTCREPAWGEKYCMQDHIIYLANSSGLKVGITRATQVPTRWIDQGATQALAIVRVRNRLQSGLMEVMFKQHVSDKTNWREMLKGEAKPVDMEVERDRLLLQCKDDIADMEEKFGFFGISLINGIAPVSLDFPIKKYPEKISPFNFNKDPVVQGKLNGIKGQYLILDTGVINIRSFSGYEITLSH